MKFYALYLPQFHQIKENDEWWGEGYTEWNAVKKACPVIKNQCQPIKPLNENYYDLSDYNSINWQAKIAKEYNISGFIIYHYWYSGKKMLETPSELLLEHPEIDLSFCFCWANHPWTKAWDGKDHLILQAQTYGNIKEWENHIQYLLRFFRDERYLKVNNKPILYIYNASAIPEYDKRMELYNEYVKKEGFDGIYIVQFISSKNPRKYGKMVDAVFEDEPLYSARFEIPFWKKIKRIAVKKMGIPDVLSYDDLWKRILKKHRTYNDIPIIRGSFCSFDNTPRRGKKQPMIVKEANPIKFGKYMELLKSSHRKNQVEDVIVINAWNEWGETAMLEPTDLYGYGYLEEIKKISEI